MLSSYPKKAFLKDNIQVSIRGLQASDKENISRFFQSLPPDDLLYMNDDVTDPKIIDELFEEIQSDNSVWLVAEKNGEIIGKGSLTHPRYGWKRKVADIHLVVSDEFKRKGLGSSLSRELLICAVKMGIVKVSVSMAEEQIGAARCVEKLGFHKDAVLKDYILDLNENLHNMIIMSFEI